MLQAYLDVRRALASSALDDLIGQIGAEMSVRWQAGERPSAAHYAALFPHLKGNRSALLGLIYEEILLLEKHGEPVDLDAICREFPALREEVEALCYFHRLLSA